MNAEPILLDPRAIQDLITRVDSQFPPGRGRLIGFMASGSGEGNSSVARSYARALSTQFRRRVLCVEASPSGAGEHSLAAALQAVSGMPAPATLSDAFGGADAPDSTWGSGDESSLWELLPRTELWLALRERFDEVVIDLPAPSASRVGLAVAPYCDGVAVVVEAEKTRAPVAEHLVGQLRSVRARVLGAVLNRRRFHLPARIYRML